MARKDYEQAEAAKAAADAREAALRPTPAPTRTRRVSAAATVAAVASGEAADKAVEK